mgnify:CR=1 FL=1
MVNRLYKFKWLILSFIFWGAVILKIPHQFLDLGGDSAQYIILAESIVEGKGYKAINYPGDPFFHYYPPVFSLLLSPIIYFWGRNFYLMHILVAFLGYLSLFFLYSIFKKYIYEKRAFLVTILFAINWLFVLYCSKYILSEIPYLFFSVLTIFFVNKYSERSSFLDRTGWFVLLGLILCYFTRYIGISLFLSTLIALLFSRQKLKKTVFIFSGFMFFFILWQVIIYILNSSFSVSHYKQFILLDPYRPFLGNVLFNVKFIILRFIEGVNYYYKILGKLFFFIGKKSLLGDFLFLLSFIIVLFGILYTFLRDKGCLLCYYFLIYFLMIVLWPFKEGERFVLPILPFAYFYFITGIKKILSFLSLKVFWGCFYGIILFLIISNVASLFLINTASKDLPPSFQHFISCNVWARRNLPSEGVIFSRKPTITYFYTNHKSMVYPFTINPDEIWREIKNNNIKYIIVDEFSRETYYYFLPFLYKYHNKLKLLYRIKNTGIFEIAGID